MFKVGDLVVHTGVPGQGSVCEVKGVYPRDEITSGRFILYTYGRNTFSVTMTGYRYATHDEKLKFVGNFHSKD